VQEKLNIQRPNRTLLAETYVNGAEKYKMWKEIYDFLGVTVGIPFAHDSVKEQILTEELLESFLERWDAHNWETDVSKIRKFICKISRKFQMDKGYWGAEPLGLWDRKMETHLVTGVIGKNMERFVHPERDRFLTFREECRLMGIPDDFEITEKERYFISQNVPALTFAAVIDQCYKNWKGELEDADSVANFHKVLGVPGRVNYSEGDSYETLIKG
jgi:site-specific DNA-cytosine methylase